MQYLEFAPNPFRREVDIFIGKVCTETCPVLALQAYLALQGAQAGPLFIWPDKKPLVKAKLVMLLRDALHEAVLVPEKICRSL